MPTVLLTAASDTYAASDAPSMSTAAKAKHLTLAGPDNKKERWSYLFFNVPFDDKPTIVKATLRLYQKGAATGGDRTLTARLITKRWAESTLRWTNKPPVGTQAKNSATLPNSSTNARLWSIDVTAMMQTIADGAPWYGFRVTSNNSTMFFTYSTDAGEFQPTLEIEWSEAPDTPDPLYPDGGRAISVARPILRSVFNDTAGNTAMSALRIQMHKGDAPPTGDPSFDSGDIEATSPQWQTTFDIAVGEKWWWRILVVDGAGLRSKFSDWASFTRTAKPTITIDNPPSSGEVTDPTPPILWSTSGPAQVAYQVSVLSETGKILWTTGKVASTDQSVTVKDAVLSPDVDYTLSVRVWDGVKREATPGDAVYAEQVMPLTLKLNGTAAPPTNVTVTYPPTHPFPLVSWERSEAPDSFSVLRDGGVVASGLAPEDVQTSPGKYEWTDFSSPPWREHTWQVVAVVNGKGSKPSDAVKSTPKPEGVWLSTVDGKRALVFDGDAPVVEPNEQSAVHYPLGARHAVVRTQSVYLRQGRVEVELGRSTPAKLEADRKVWAGFVRNRTDPLILVAGDLSAKVMIYNTSTGVFREESAWNAVGLIPVAFNFVEVD